MLPELIRNLEATVGIIGMGYDLVLRSAPLVVDTRNALKAHRQSRASIVTL